MTDETQFPTVAFPGPANTPTDVPLPAEIGGFRILSVLGHGGMGIVYEAEQQNPRRRVALKVVRAGGPVNELRLRLFQREAETLARLAHPGIAALYEAGHTTDGQHFLTMELVAGQPLDAYVREHMGGDKPTHAQLRDRLRIFESICRAVSYAHQRGVIHRDLKPSNIFVVAEAPRGASGSHPVVPESSSISSSSSSSSTWSHLPQVKILDFGLARIVATEADLAAGAAPSSVMTQLGDIRGTLPYMSPEQARGDSREVDSRSDVYALGVILYEMLTGRLPIETQTGSLVSALQAICEEPPKSLAISFSGGFRIDPDIQTIVGKALEKDPDQRYASADALAEDVQRYLANQPILAHPPSALYQLRKLVARHRFASWTAAGVLVLLAATAIALALQEAKVRLARDRAEKEAARAGAINKFLVTTFGAADPWQRGERGVTLVAALKHAEGEVHATFAKQPEVEADVLVTIARTYIGLGQYGDAEKLLRNALKLRNAAGARQTEGGADTLAALSEALRVENKFDEAIVQSREDLAIRRALHGAAADDGGIAAALDSLAYSLGRKGEYAEAEKLGAEALAMRRRVYGERSDEAAMTLQTLGTLALDQQDYKRQEATSRERLEIMREVHGDPSAQVAEALNDLAVARMQQGDLAGAEKLFNETLAMHRQVFGEDHPEVASTLENLGNVWYQTNRAPQTIQSLERVLAMRKRAFGDDSALVTRTLANLATVNSASGNPAAAVPLYAQALDGMIRFYGPESPEVSEVLLGQGRNFDRLGQLPEAEKSLRGSLAIRVATFGPDATPTARTRFMLGRVLTEQKRYPEADEQLRLSDAAYRKNEGLENTRTQETIQARIALYRAWGKGSEADALEKDVKKPAS